MPKANVIFSHYKFQEKIQAANESFEQFLTDLRLLVKDCAYANSEELVRDCIVFCIYSPVVREKLLSVGSEQTLDINRSYSPVLTYFDPAKQLKLQV